MNDDLKWLDQFIKSAAQLGHLEASTIWALLSLGLTAYLVYTIKQTRISDKEWQRIRSQEAEADSSMSRAVEKLADELAQIKLMVIDLLRR